MFEEKHPVWTRARFGKNKVHWVAYDDRPGVEGRQVVAQGYAASLTEADAAARSALAEAGMYQARRASTAFGASASARGKVKDEEGKAKAERPKAPDRPAPARPREYLYTRQHSDDDEAPFVSAHLILRKTPRKVYVTRRSRGPDQLGTEDEQWGEAERAIALDRAALERDGSVYSSGHRLSDFYATREAAMGDAPRSGPSPFRVLGLQAPCTLEEIRGAFRRKALEAHPDRGGNPADFRAIEAAYRQLVREAQGPLD